jgi:hypothetical protein
MPVIIEINTAAKLVRSIFTGEMTEGDFLSAVAQLSTEPGFDPDFTHIIDFSAVTAANVSTAFVTSFAREKPLFNRTARQVVVAPQNSIFGLARMVQMLREQQLPNIDVVRSLPEAYEILGIEQAGQ